MTSDIVTISVIDNLGFEYGFTSNHKLFTSGKMV